MREVRGGPAGGGYSTAGDMLKFHLALRENKLLDAEHTELVMTGKVEGGQPIGKYAYGFGDKEMATASTSSDITAARPGLRRISTCSRTTATPRSFS